MTPRTKYWIFICCIALAVFAVIFGSFFASWYNLDGHEQQFFRSIVHKIIPFPFIGAIFLFMIISIMVSLLFNFYILPILKLGEETKLISVVNPEHRIKPKGAKELIQLTRIINQSAEAFEKLQHDVDDQVQQAKAQLKLERNRLAALMSELPHGVLVCNTDGQILLYNPQAQRLIRQTGKMVGLGRSLFSVLEREPFVHSFDTLNQAFRQGQGSLSTRFMMTVQDKVCLLVNMTPIITEQNGESMITGFVLTLEDMTEQIETDLERDQLLQTMTEAMQFSTGEIRHAITRILNHPELKPEELREHRLDIDRASQALQDQLEHIRSGYTRYSSVRARTENVLGTDLLELVSTHMSNRLGVRVTHRGGQDLWLRLDSFTLVQGLARLGDILSQQDVRSLKLELNLLSDHQTELKISWPGSRMAAATLREWQRRPLLQDAHQQPASFVDLISQYGGEVILAPPEQDECECLCLILPLIEPEAHWQDDSGPEHRPIYYEFDLFQQTGGDELFNVPLKKLTFVVFDTETTGLNPSEGDEIIQIGAIRIVNGNVLYDETIDQLVDPQRHVPQSSIDIHGIDPQLLVGQPTIEKALPDFHHFAESSVLVAHNAAFDMRFLQIKEDVTGLAFDHPVLDTLLLSSVVHPNRTQHSLDEIARLFNIPVVGRHTALGDAIVTAEVLVKLIPLLEAEGIRTLKEAIDASSASPFAKLKY